MSSIYNALDKKETDFTHTTEKHDLNMTSLNDEQQPWTSTYERLFYSYQRYNELRRKDDAIKERFNDLQTKLQELDVLHQSPNEFFRTTTPSSRDSGVPIRSSSSCCSVTSEISSTQKSSLELPFDQLTSPSPQTSVLHFFLYPPIDSNQRHVSVHLNEETTEMSTMHDTMPRYQSHGRSVHWNDEKSSSAQPHRSSSQHIFQQENPNEYCNSDSNMIKKRGQRISLNASLPYDSKLNIRVHADRKQSDDKNDNNLNQVKATATVEPLNNLQHEQEHSDTLRRHYLEHYSTMSPNGSLITTRTSSPVQLRTSRRDRLPRHRQVSLPISLPVDQRLYLYIRNGEVLARC
ncbi:unnamed protein product [Rotaria magnacalcarata]|uniref:Uncharacterized protein n=5 Tax=Rotaria magnacalcarata TaxID=392030 RepID=A0A816P220_9BILA|nr:unnamed protein product [Rotaria magnacalcarata]CAF2092455.1 unnamed protein product [Rotaria magnacalcarata]CAF3725305.1 unnamed protein product [Rotaria magnacalcarata]CAF3924136.1 unnamed protein product [Rotaria magnacalcarata]